jgi:hypothetical protein
MFYADASYIDNLSSPRNLLHIYSVSYDFESNNWETLKEEKTYSISLSYSTVYFEMFAVLRTVFECTSKLSTIRVINKEN